MKLHADEPGMILMLDHLRQEPVRRHAGKAHAMLLQAILVAGIDLVAMAVTLGNFPGTIFSLTRLPRSRRAGYAPSRIVPPRLLSRPRIWRSFPFIHSVISPTTGLGVAPNSASNPRPQSHISSWQLQ